MRALIGKISETHIGALLALSYLLFSAIFWAYPFIWLIILSFSDWRFFDAPIFSGLHNLVVVLSDPEFWGEVQPPASLKGLDIPSRRTVFVPWKPSRRPAFGMGNPTFR